MTRYRIALPLLIVLAFPAIASAQWYRDYQDGINAVKAKNWSVAEQKLQAAMQKNPRADTRDRILWYGQIRRPFLPSLYLAVVYQNTRRPQQALDILQRLRDLYRSGDDDYQLFATTMAAASDDVATNNAGRLTTTTIGPPRATSTVPVSTTTTTSPGPPPSSSTSSSTTTSVGVTPPAPSRTEFDRLMREAEVDLRAGRFPDARRKAEQARGLNVDGAAVEALLREVQTAELLRTFTSAVTGRDPTKAAAALETIRKTNPGYGGLQKLVTDLRDLRDVIDLRAGLLLYYASNYTAAATLFQGALQRGGAAPRLYLYLACSIAALSLVNDNPADLVTARTYFAQARPQQNRYTADWRYISPSIRRALESGPTAPPS